LEVSNHSQISLLSYIEKIYEKVYFLNQHKKIYSRQFGFCKSHYNSHCIDYIVEHIRESVNKGEYACGGFVDL